MPDITKITFIADDGEKQELHGVNGELFIHQFAEIRLDPAEYASADVRGWDIVAGDGSTVHYTGEVIDILEQPDYNGPVAEYVCLPASTK